MSKTPRTEEQILHHDNGNGHPSDFVFASFARQLETELADKDKLIEQLKLALKSAEQFIENGVEYGYITMPDPETPDKAHKMLPEIKAALSAAERITK